MEERRERRDQRSGDNVDDVGGDEDNVGNVRALQSRQRQTKTGDTDARFGGSLQILGVYPIKGNFSM